MEETRVLATCSLGLGFSYRGFQAGLAMDPHLIAADAGSSDFGPYYLGAGAMQKGAMSLKRDLTVLIEGALKLGVPFCTGSVGGPGAKVHLDVMVDLVTEIARERGWHFKLAAIDSEVDKALIKGRIREGRVRPLGGFPDLTEEGVDELVRCVGMIGAEPYIRALDEGAQVILAGRTTDPSIFVAEALRRGAQPGAAWHAAKCIDKGYLATTTPEDGSPVLARINGDEFTLEPTKADSRCTVQSVAQITLHENSDPFQIAQPTGVIDTHQTRYEAIDERRVRVTGSRYLPAKQPTIKLEGAKLVGYRRILLAGLRDPRLIARIDEYLDAYREKIRLAARSMEISETDYTLQFRVYGRDAVMGPTEPLRDKPGHELGLVVDVVGKTKEIAAAIATRLGPTGSRMQFLEGMGGGGNFAYPFSPSNIDVGAAYEWGAWHLMEVDWDELTDLFPIAYYDL